MKKSVKAALLSGLVFPGLGQVWVKRYLRGIAIMLITLSLLGFLIGITVMNVWENMEKLQSQGRTLDMNDIAGLAASLSSGQTLAYNAGVFLVLCCWIFSISDAYRIGKTIDGR